MKRVLFLSIALSMIFAYLSEARPRINPKDFRVYSENFGEYYIGDSLYTSSSIRFTVVGNRPGLVVFPLELQDFYREVPNGNLEWQTIFLEYGNTLNIKDNNVPSIDTFFYKFLKPGETFEVFVLHRSSHSLEQITGAFIATGGPADNNLPSNIFEYKGNRIIIRL